MAKEKEKIHNGVYDGFRTSGKAADFAVKHGVEHYNVFWSQADKSWAVYIDD